MGAVDLVLQVESPKSVTARPAAHRPRRPQRRRHLQGPHLPEVPRRPARVRGRRPAHARGPDRDDRRPAQPARRARPADRRDGRLGRRRRAAARRRPPRAASRAPTPTPSSRARSSRTCSTCSTAATRREEFGELRPRIVWDRVAGHDPRPQGRARARDHQRRHDPRPRPVLRQPARRPPRRRARRGDGLRGAARARRSCSARRRWRIEEITRDRVIVTPAPGRAGRGAVLAAATASGRPRELGEAIGAFARWAVEQDAETLERDYDLDRAAPRSNLLDFLREQQDATRVVPSDRTIVVERFRDEIGDWRLCILSPYGGRVHAAWGLALSAAHPRRVRPRVRRDLVRRRDHRPPPRRRRAAGRGARADRPRRARGPGRRRARRLRAVRRALPRERRPRAADPARLPGPAHAAVAAAAEVADAARGRQALRAVPDRARDLPRVPARRARRARACSDLLRKLHSRELSAGRGRDADRVAVRLLAAVRLRRDLHVRGRHAQRRAPRRRAGARPRAAARAARPGGAARADRPGRARAGRGRPAAHLRAHARGLASTRCTTCCAASATSRSRRPARARRRPDATPRRGSSSSRGERRAMRAARSAASGAGPPPRTPACYRDALGAVPPSGLPEAFLADVPDAMERLVRRCARTHGPFETRALRERYGLDLTPVLAGLERAGELVRGELRPGGTRARVVRPRGAAAAAARLAGRAAQGDRAGRPARARALPARAGRASTATRRPAPGIDRLREVLVPLQGLALPAEVWERDVLPRRVGAYSPALAGPAVRGGRGRLDRRGRARPPLGPRRAVLPRGRRAARPAAAAAPTAPAEPAHEAIRERLRGGACFFTDLLVDVAGHHRPRSCRRRCGTSCGRAR